MVANPLEEFYCGFNVLLRPLPRLWVNIKPYVICSGFKAPHLLLG